MSGYRIEDLLADSTAGSTDTTGVDRRTQSGGFDVADLLEGDTATRAPAPTPRPARAVAPAPAPTRGRGIVEGVRRRVAGIGDALSSTLSGALAEVGRYGPGEEQSGGTTASRYEEPEETRRLATIADRRSPEQRLASARAPFERDAASDVTRVAPAGSPQLRAERSATQAGLAQKETNERNFTPKQLRDLASRGDVHADSLFAKADSLAPVDAVTADAIRAAAEDAKKRAINAEIVADDLEQSDTFGEIARSSLLGIVHDPNAGQKRNLMEYASDPSLSFSPEEQTGKLGKNLPVGRERGFDITKDVTAPLVGSLPLYVAGGMAGRLATQAAAAGLAVRGAPRAAKILDALSAEIETTGIYGPKQAGMAGLREAAGNFAENAPKLALRGATEGQAVGAVQAAREAQQTGADPIQAAAMSAIMNVPFGIAGELGLGAAARALGVADRSITGALDRVISRIEPYRERAKSWLEAIGPTNPVERPILTAMDQGATEAGKTPVSDKTLEGQRGDLARALEAALAMKEEAPNFGSDAGLIERDRTALTPRPEEVEPNAPLRSARDVGLERAGVAPEDPLAQVDANVQMRRAAQEAELIEQQQLRDAEALRLETARQAADAATVGPRQLAETLEQAGREREAGEPLAADYHEAINKFADVSARMEDATKEGGTPSAKLKVDYARARGALNEIRQKYGKQAGAAAILTLGANDDDLTENERKFAGLGLLAVAASTEHVGKPDPFYTAKEFGYHEKTALWSRLERAVELDEFGAKPKPAEQWIGRITKNSRISKAEIEETILPWLKEQAANKVQLTKQEVLDKINETLPNVEVTRNTPIDESEMPERLADEIGEASANIEYYGDERDRARETANEKLGSLRIEIDDRDFEKYMQSPSTGKRVLAEQWKIEALEVRSEEYPDETEAERALWFEQEAKPQIDQALSWLDEAHSYERNRDEAESNHYHLTEYADWSDYRDEDESGAQHMGAQEYSESQNLSSETYHEVRVRLDQLSGGGTYDEGHWPDEDNVIVHYRARDVKKATLEGEKAAREGVVTPHEEELQTRHDELNDQLKALNESEMARLEAAGHDMTRLPALRQFVAPETLAEAGRIRDEMARVYDEMEPLKKARYRKIESSARDRTRVHFEFQANYATQAADRGGFRRKIKPSPERLAELEGKYDAARKAWDDHLERGGTSEPRIANQEAQDTLTKALTEWAHTVPEAERADFSMGYFRNADPDPKAWTFSMLRSLYDDVNAADAKVDAALARRAETQRAFNEAAIEADELSDVLNEARRNFDNADVVNPDSPSPASPITSHREAIALGVKQAVLDAVEDNLERFAWATPDDRVDLANLGRATADLIYGDWVPGTLKAIHRALGEPFSIEHVSMDEYELPSFKLTREFKEKVRKYGLPFVSVAALLGNPDDAEAQGTDGAGDKATRLYATGSGIIAAGALVAAVAQHRKLRALLKENREMSRALHLDDLSGLSNKRALSRAVESIDRDPATSWIVLDGNRFKAMNDTHGHPEGDRAIAHFGKVVRQVAEQFNVPMRGFRAGGDEFAFAAPKEKAAEILRAIEEQSPYTKGGVTTSLTGEHGDTFAEADALLTHTKAQNRTPRGTISHADAAEQLANSIERNQTRAAESRVGAGGRGRDANAQPYARRSVEGTGPRRVLDTDVQAVAEHVPEPALTSRLSATGHTAPTLLELASDETSAATFHKAITSARDASPHGAAVYVYDQPEYAGMRLFLSDQGKTGFALKGDDIVSVFSTEKGGRAAHALAIAQGGRTLDAFDTVLPSIYASNGMRVVSRLPWDDTQAPPAWNHETFAKFNNGRPDVVFMVHDPAFTGDRLAGEMASSYDEAVAMQQAAKQRSSRPLDLYSNPIGAALGELRRAPGVAGVAAIGAIAANQDDNEMIRRTGVPIMALAALHAIGSRRIGAGKDMLASKLVEQLRKTRTGTKTVRAFNPDALLSPEVRTAVRQYERDRSRATAVASHTAQKAKALGPEGDRAVSDVLDREAWEGVAAQTPEVLTVALQLADEYDKATKAQLAAGTLAPENVLPDYGGPRKYAHYEVAHALADKPGRGGGAGPSPRIAKTQTRTLDIPIREAQAKLAEAHKTGDAAKIQTALEALDLAEYESAAQRVERGEIREASYRAAAGIEKAYQNVAAAKLFETLRATPGVAHPEWIKAVDDYQTATSLKRAAKTQADKDAADLMVGNATAALDELQRRFKQKGQDYVALPDSPSWGMLRGAVVQRDVAHSLEGFGHATQYSKALRAWKEMKTVFNPGTNVGNILSNVTALHVGDVPMWLQPLYYKRALADLKTYGEAAQALTEAGVMHVNSTSDVGSGVATSSSMRSAEGLEQLLATTRPETADVIRRESQANSEYAITEPAIAARAKSRLKKGAAVGAVVGAARGYDEENPERAGIGAAIGAGLGALAASGKGDLIRKIYGHEDNLARMAIFLRRRALGDTKDQALEAAISGLGDFRTRSPALRLASQTVSPFILYQAKAVPAFAAKIIDHPYKWLSLIAAWGAVNELSKREVGEVPEEDRDERDRATWGYFFPGFTQLPIKNEEGDKGATDMARYTPFGGLATGAPPGSVPEAFSGDAPQVATPGGPVLDLALRAANVHPFTKKPLFNRDAPLKSNIATALGEATDLALPSAAGYHLRQLTADYDNRDWTKLKNDLLGPVGSKPRYVREGQVEDRAEFEFKQRMSELKYLRERALDANKNPARDDDIDARFDALEDAAEAAFERRTTPPPRGTRP